MSPKVIGKYIDWFQKENPSFNYEIIIVDDGSKDKTTQVCKKKVFCRSTYQVYNSQTVWYAKFKPGHCEDICK